MFKFTISKKLKNARVARFATPHGVIDTPAFIPVATKATIKTLDSNDVRNIGFNSILSNTYHLMLQPGADLVKKMGGLHNFMNWQGPIFTDSGGYQVFSLGKGLAYGVGKVCKKNNSAEASTNKKSLVKITDNGVEFRSHLDGKKIFLRPEDSIRIQEKLGADIIFAFDECTSPTDSRAYLEKSLERTHKWAERCLKAHKRKDQALFGIIQGGDYKKLREAGARFISALPFNGFGIGGSFGKKEMLNVLEWTIPFLPENKPRHMLGIGVIEDIFEAVGRGVDTFDCVEPTRLGRHGTLFTKSGRIRILSAKYRADKKPIEADCKCELCINYSRSYLHHLFKANEILGMRLATIHNLTFMHNLMKNIRQSIKSGKFNYFKSQFLRKFRQF
ncbi:MAG: tRNA guanosine(34) transglycosylase Tgt [Parcubacteria group bacterium CG10_big_fil_rev_8_21_14_0_10_36_14]|nr:MAG: tRNA guanosine(34) transglycosylase Tgt [Parcubacteria group bacterium CG10_big_fil_rev_8_21_14_0_10_36_14]